MQQELLHRECILLYTHLHKNIMHRSNDIVALLLLLSIVIIIISLGYNLQANLNVLTDSPYVEFFV